MNMIGNKALGRAMAGVLAAGFLLLSGCSEKEFILPGEREDIRPVDDGAAAVAAGNVSRSIRLPSQRRNAEWAQPYGTESYRVSNAALRVVPQRVWSTQIGEGEGRRVRITAAPVVGGGRIYTLDSGARVSAVTPDGAVIWTADLTPPSDSAGQATGGGLAYAGGTVYVSLGFGYLVALDAATGGVKWRQQLDATGSGSPTVRDGLVYLVAGDDTGWAVRADNGRIAWQLSATPSVANVLGAPAPALTRDFVIFAFGSGDLVAAFRRGGLRRWDASVTGQRQGRALSRIGDITGAPVVSGSRIYAGNQSGRIVALSVDKGERIWTAREGAIGPVWPAGDSVFALTDTNRLTRLSASDGTAIWSVPLPGFVKDKPRKRGKVYAHHGPILAGGRIVVASNDGLLRFFSPENGSLIGSVEVPDGATTGPVVANGTLYVVSTKGQLHAFR